MSKAVFILLFICSVTTIYGQSAKQYCKQILNLEKYDVIHSMEMDQKGILTYEIKNSKIVFTIPMASIVIEKHDADPEEQPDVTSRTLLILICSGNEECISITDPDGTKNYMSFDIFKFDTKASRDMASKAFEGLRKIARGEK